MTQNDILRRIRYILDLDDSKIDLCFFPGGTRGDTGADQRLAEKRR